MSTKTQFSMHQIKWFERSFDFSNDQNVFPSILERLDGTFIRLERKIAAIPKDILKVKFEDKWSIQENIGHLMDLEPLWQGRLEDILDGREVLRETDLENTKTYEAGHNSKEVKELIDGFGLLRRKTMKSLRSLKEEDVFKYSLHPRLKTPMRMMDLFLFVAEHDDHHLAEMSRLQKELSQNV